MILFVIVIVFLVGIKYLIEYFTNKTYLFNSEPISNYTIFLIFKKVLGKQYYKTVRLFMGVFYILLGLIFLYFI